MTLPTSIVARPRVNLPHHRIHEGRMFILTTTATGLPANIPKYYFGTSPPAQIATAHVIFIITVNPGVIFELFEGAVTSGGIQLFSVNNDRNNPVLATGTFFEDPVVTFEGTTKLWEEIIGSSTAGGTGGPKDRDEDEIVTASVTNYLLKIVPLANNTNLTVEIPAYSQPGPGFI
jgi:hypothetical protein